MAKWYYSAEGHATGPVTEQELGALASRGVVCTDTLIWEPAMEEWEPVWKLKPGIIEQLNKSAMARQAKGTTDQIPAVEPAQPQPKLQVAEAVPAPKPVASVAPTEAAPVRADKPVPNAPVDDQPKSGFLTRLFGRKKK